MDLSQTDPAPSQRALQDQTDEVTIAAFRLDVEIYEALQRFALSIPVGPEWRTPTNLVSAAGT